MADRDAIQRLVASYVDAVGRQDVDAVLALVEPDGAHDDVTGEGRYVGHPAIRAFLEQLFAVGFAARLDGPVGIHGDVVGFRYVIEVPAGRTPFRLLVTAMAELGQGPSFSSLRTVTDSQVLNL